MMKLHDLQVGQRFSFSDKHRGKVFEVTKTAGGPMRIIEFKDVATGEIRLTHHNRKTFRMEVELVTDDNFMPFNLNEHIKVRLFDAGYQHLADIHNQYVGVIPRFESRTAEFYRQQADKDGYTAFQAWEFIRDFGPMISFGSQQIFDINILVELGSAGRRVVLPNNDEI